jgi:hypothetical protein
MVVLMMVCVSNSVVQGSPIRPINPIRPLGLISMVSFQNVATDACCDADPEQWTAAVEEFQAISDGSTAIQPEELPAYWRIMNWVQQQPNELLRQRKTESARRNDFLQRPDKLRGQLFTLNLQVCRVLPYEIEDNPLGIRQLYEVWGWVPTTGAWLYVAVVPELPPGFPTGETVDEPAMLTGYFFKLQGYVETGAPPRSKPLQAPMFLGRLHRTEQLPASPPVFNYVWIGGLSLLAVAFLYRTTRLFVRSRARKTYTSARADRDHPLSAEQWLSGVQSQGSPSSFENGGRSCDRTLE